MEVIAVIGAAIVALIGIIFGVKTRKEGTVLPGVLEFDPSRLPILLLFHASIPSRVLLAAGEAVEFWNRVVGRDIFTLTVVEGGSEVPLMPFSGNESERRATQALAYADLTMAPGGKCIKSASVKIDLEKLEGASDLYLDIAHELGHVLGLKHDADPASIMYGKSTAWRPNVVLSEVDRQIILEGYGLNDE